MDDYCYGAAHEIYAESFSTDFIGLTFTDAAWYVVRASYQRHHSFLPSFCLGGACALCSGSLRECHALNQSTMSNIVLWLSE